MPSPRQAGRTKGSSTIGQAWRHAAARQAPRRRASSRPFRFAALPCGKPVPVPHSRSGTQSGQSWGSKVFPQGTVGLSSRLARCSSSPRCAHHAAKPQGCFASPAQSPELAAARAGLYGGKPLRLSRMAQQGSLASGAAALVGAFSGSSRPSLHCACAPGGGGSRPRSPPSSAPRRALLLRCGAPCALWWVRSAGVFPPGREREGLCCISPFVVQGIVLLVHPWVSTPRWLPPAPSGTALPSPSRWAMAWTHPLRWLPPAPPGSLRSPADASAAPPPRPMRCLFR